MMPLQTYQAIPPHLSKDFKLSGHRHKNTLGTLEESDISVLCPNDWVWALGFRNVEGLVFGDTKLFN